MIILLSPAKSLDFSAHGLKVKASKPPFPDRTAQIAKAASKLTRPKIKKLMNLSDDLADLNYQRFQSFEADRAANAPAALTFAGDVYRGLDARSLNADDMTWAQDHVRILSGLYGLLRPMDAMQEYRLEMGSRLKTRRGGSLYDYWGDQIAKALNAEAERLGTDTLINCASVEYFTAANRKALKPRVITPQFLEEKPGGPKIVSFFAKKARGAMARFIITRRLTDPEGILEFDTGGYEYAPELSEEGKPAFLRPASAA